MGNFVLLSISPLVHSSFFDLGSLTRRDNFPHLNTIDADQNQENVNFELCRKLIFIQFSRHYANNRAPISLSFDTAWLKVNKGFTKELAKWMRELLQEHNDVYFVTNLQVSAEKQLVNSSCFSGPLENAVEYFSIYHSVQQLCTINGQKMQ